MKSQALLLSALCLLLALTGAAWAEGTKSLTVTVYNDGLGLINEVRDMELAQGQSRVEFTGVAETIQAPTLQVRSQTAPQAFNVLDMNYEYDLVSVQNLLDRYVGKQLMVVLPDSKDDNAKQLREATLLANNGQPVFQVGDQIYVGPYESALLPEIPKGLRAKPTLVWLVDNQGPARQDIEVSYLANSMSWKADYVLKVDRDNAQAGLSGWITLQNESGMAFENASLKLVAGEINRARDEIMYKGRAMAENMAMAAAPVQEEEFFEYHLYNIGRPVDLGNRQTKQISLLQAPRLGVNKVLLAEYDAYPSGRRQVDIKQKVKVFLEFKNSERNGLGMPLPKGVVRAYQESQDGSTLFIGEDNLDHTPKDADVRLEMGEAFDVQVERRLASMEQIGKNIARYSWDIKIRNSKDKPQAVVLRERLPGDWRVERTNHEFTQLDAKTIEFRLMVPPSSEQDQLTINYEVMTEL